mgnify:CR=1 FL=1
MNNILCCPFYEKEYINKCNKNATINSNKHEKTGNQIEWDLGFVWCYSPAKRNYKLEGKDPHQCVNEQLKERKVGNVSLAQLNP